MTPDDRHRTSTPDSEASETSPPSPRPGASTFTIEGRAAPALFVVGWLASILGLAVAIAGALAGSSTARLLRRARAAVARTDRRPRATRRSSAGHAAQPTPGPSPILVFAATVAVTYFVAPLLGLLLDAVVRSTGTTVWPPIGQLIAAALTALIFVGVIRLTVVGTGALSWSDMGIRPFDRQAIADLVAGASLALPVIGVTLIVGAVLVSAFKVVSPSPLPPTGELSGLLLQLITGAIIAPVAEEILFRGFAVTAWRRSHRREPGDPPGDAALRARPRRRHRGDRLRPGDRADRRRRRDAPAGRVGPRLDLRPARLDLGSDRAARNTSLSLLDSVASLPWSVNKCKVTKSRESTG